MAGFHCMCQIQQTTKDLPHIFYVSDKGWVQITVHYLHFYVVSNHSCQSHVYRHFFDHKNIFNIAHECAVWDSRKF